MYIYRAAAAVLASLLTCTAASQSKVNTRQGDRQVVLIKAGRLFDVKSGKYFTDRCVLVEGEGIRAVGGRGVCAQAPKRSTVIDLGRATLLPGLIDCHSHLFSRNEGQSDPTARLTEAQRLDVAAANASEYLEAGFTTVRNLGYGINGDAVLRDRINAGLLPGPRILAATRKLTPPGGQGVTPDSPPDFIRNFAEVSGVESARRAVRENISSGADVIKVVVDVGPRLLSAEEMAAIVEEAHLGKRKVAAHATGAWILEDAEAAGGHRAEAARRLGINRRLLYSKMEEHKLA